MIDVYSPGVVDLFQLCIIKLQLNGWWLLWLFFLPWNAESSKYALHCCTDIYLTSLLAAPWLQLCKIQIWQRLNIVWQTWILGRDCDETRQVSLLRVPIWTEKGLGYENVIYFLKIILGWKAISPHGWNLPGGYITMGVGVWGHQPDGCDMWLWWAVLFTSLYFTLLSCLPLCMQW